ncbi:unnamed protein product [Prunus brigantina]
MLEKTYGTQALRWETKEEEEPFASLREDPLSRDEEMTHHFQLSLRDFYFYKDLLVSSGKRYPVLLVFNIFLVLYDCTNRDPF